MTRCKSILAKGRYLVREAEGPDDLEAVRRLRARAFKLTEPDADAYDASYRHFLIQDVETGKLTCSFRIALLSSNNDLDHSYCGSFHDLSRLIDRGDTLVELGRFCIEPDIQDPDILRVAWAALTKFVDAKEARVLIGCVSFPGLDPDKFRDAFALLSAQHLAPDEWRPEPRVENVIRFARNSGQTPDRKAALLQMPTLLRSYLSIGGCVGDCAIIDPLFQTLHIFAGLEVSEIPEARKARLRAMLA